MKPYYYINYYGRITLGARIKTLDEAIAHASEYAANSPGEAYEILQCIGIVQTPAPQPPESSTFWMDGCGPPIAIQEPQLPEGLPPLPQLPIGYDRWEYRGMGWNAKRVTYATCEPHNDEWYLTWIDSNTHGNPAFHYIEAIKST